MIIGISGKIGSGKDTVAGIINYLVWKSKVESGECKTLVWNIEDFLYGRPTQYFKNKKFADSLKDIVCILLGCTREQLENREFKEKELGEEWWKYKVHDGSVFRYVPKESYLKTTASKLIEKLTPRKILQLLGTECGRDILHPNIWVNVMMNHYKPVNKGSVCDKDCMTQLYSHKNCSNCKCSYVGWKQQYLCNECISDDNVQIYPDWVITDMRFPNELEAIKDRNGITIRINRDFEQVFKDKGIHVPKHLLSPEHPSETALDNAEFDYVVDNDGSIEDLISEIEAILTREKIIPYNF